jgi:outer membrane protein assembly factor BamB
MNKMNTEEQELSKDQAGHKSLRLWPGVVIVLLQWLIRYVIPLLSSSDKVLAAGVFAGILGGLAVAVWWAFFSRANKYERWGAVLLMIVALFGASRLLDKSIATANMGMMFAIVSIPLMSLAFTVWAVASQGLSNRTRRLTMVLTIVFAAGVWTLLRTNGMTSHLHHDLAWRWAKTQEEKFLTQSENETMSLPAATKTLAFWPGFRGQNRDGIVYGTQIKTDWKASPPALKWQRPIGPGCSSFAVGNGLLYTQEQRGNSEAVVCYDLATGKPVWIHTDNARFWDSHAGAGPRSTPTLSNGYVVTFGATGILNVLNAGDGKVVWSRNAATDTGEKENGWGFTSSPLVAGDVVIVAATGKLAAYDLSTGKPRWVGPDGGKGYSSPHLLKIGGVDQVLLMCSSGVISLAPDNGTLLWKYQWPLGDPILQPAQISDGDILLGGDMSHSMRRIAVTHETAGWKVTERWTSSGMTPYFNDFVVHNGHAYGFDGLSLACVGIEDGKRNWRAGRYGGQLILLADQNLLLVLSEKGELALVSASPDKFVELARLPAIKGKTWNHPVLAGDILVVRNGQEMAAFKLMPASN